MVDIFLSFKNKEQTAFCNVIKTTADGNILTIKNKADDIITINAENINYAIFKPVIESRENQPENGTAEKKGKWLKTDAYPHHVYCSECYKTYVTNEEIIQGRGWERVYCTEAEFCPHCGVKMETEQGGGAGNDRQ